LVSSYSPYNQILIAFLLLPLFTEETILI
jgi:hypothetical protein